MSNFTDQIIKFWVITYDRSVDRVYIFTDFSQVVMSVEASIRGYLGDNPSLDGACAKICGYLKKLEYQAIIPIVINQLDISIIRLELDKTSKIHGLLLRCYDHVDKPLQDEIACLFSDAV